MSELSEMLKRKLGWSDEQIQDFNEFNEAMSEGGVPMSSIGTAGKVLPSRFHKLLKAMKMKDADDAAIAAKVRESLEPSYGKEPSMQKLMEDVKLIDDQFKAPVDPTDMAEFGARERLKLSAPEVLEGAEDISKIKGVSSELDVLEDILKNEKKKDKFIKLRKKFDPQDPDQTF